MIAKSLAALIAVTLLSSCSLMGTKEVEIISKPIEIDILQQQLPREINLIEPQWYVVSEAKIANPCVKNEEGKRERNEDNNLFTKFSFFIRKKYVKGFLGQIAPIRKWRFMRYLYFFG